MRRLIKNKKAIEVWISWVLLMGFVAVLSTMMYDFMQDYTKETTTDLKRVTADTAECNLVAISIDSVCKQNATSPIYLNITVTNRMNINIDELMFRTFDSSNMFVNISRLNMTNTVITLRPDQSKKLMINISDASVDSLQVIPVVHQAEGDLVITCRNKLVEYSGISEC